MAVQLRLQPGHIMWWVHSRLQSRPAQSLDRVNDVYISESAMRDVRWMHKFAMIMLL
jgi:hypothetical protein